MTNVLSAPTVLDLDAGVTPSIQALAVLGVTATGDIAIAAGYADPRDGGGGQFCFEVAADVPDSATITGSVGFSVDKVSTAAGQTMTIVSVRPTRVGGKSAEPPIVTTDGDHPFWDGQEVQLNEIAVGTHLTAAPLTPFTSLEVASSAVFRKGDFIRVSGPGTAAVITKVVGDPSDATHLTVETPVPSALIEAFVDYVNDVDGVANLVDLAGHPTNLHTTLTAGVVAGNDLPVENFRSFQVGDAIRISSPGLPTAYRKVTAVTPGTLPAGTVTVDGGTLNAFTGDWVDHIGSPICNRVWRITTGGDLDDNQFSLRNAPGMAGAGGIALGLTIQVTTDDDHGFEDGQAIKISGVVGDTSANDAWIVTVRDDTTFLLNDSLGTGTGNSGTAESTVITTADAHNLVPGQQVVIGGVSDPTALNGVWGGAGTTRTTVGCFGPFGKSPTRPTEFSISQGSDGSAAAGTIGDGARQVPSTSQGPGRWLRQYTGALHARWFGAKGDGTTDDAAAISAAIHGASCGDPWVGSEGFGIEQHASVVVFSGRAPTSHPADGTYACWPAAILNRTSCLKFDTIANVILKGPGRINFKDALAYPMGGSAPFMQLLGVGKITFEDLILTYENAAFVGPLIATGAGTYFGNDPSAVRWYRCVFYGPDVIASQNASSFLSLDHLICSSIRDCAFSAARIAIRGCTTSHSSNQVVVEGCIFRKLVSCSIYNAAEVWLIQGNTFEPPADHASRGAYDQSLDYTVYGFNFNGNWCGDGGVGGTWITVKGFGLHVHGNVLSSSGTDVVLRIAGSNGGLSVMGNFIRGFVEFVRDVYGLTSSGAVVAGNTFTQDPTPILGLDLVSNELVMGNINANINSLPMPVTQVVSYYIDSTISPRDSPAQIPASATIVRATLVIITPFSVLGGPHTIDIGQPGNTKFLQTNTVDNDATTAGVYDKPQRLNWGASTLPVRTTIGGGPMAGFLGIVTVEYYMEQ